ncbi:hypothetical protein CEXT_558311 [Caerostris extrusa]|uniref:Uncharacterized protein n=1 Tax=Caerostris extrusa TaxID=172846 RepID=A0AAV4WAJ5_CAEEX|nr:hypothetical protein CEXT_558311 [Caerostris extrusa]
MTAEGQNQTKPLVQKPTTLNDDVKTGENKPSGIYLQNAVFVLCVRVRASLNPEAAVLICLDVPKKWICGCLLSLPVNELSVEGPPREARLQLSDLAHPRFGPPTLTAAAAPTSSLPPRDQKSKSEPVCFSNFPTESRFSINKLTRHSPPFPLEVHLPGRS